jgi:hypothetical protein
MYAHIGTTKKNSVTFFKTLSEEGTILNRLG